MRKELLQSLVVLLQPGDSMKALKTLLCLFLTSTLITACSSSNEKKTEFVAKYATSVITKEVIYKSGDMSMKGFLAMPEGEGPFPGVLVVHEWWGQTDYPRERAKQLARNGYAAFAVDMYGDGEVVEHPKDAKAFAGKVMEDMDKAEESFRVALATLRLQDKVDGNKTAALGYCFGGAIVLEMARRGVEMKMVASYHGSLSPLVENDIPSMKTRILIFNGAADPFVPKESITMARAKLKAAKVRYKLISYKGAKHSFTNPEATANGEKFKMPLAYDERADKKSWEETMNAFKIVFK